MFDWPPADADVWEWMAFPIWRYASDPAAAVYAWFNIAEAIAWWAIGAWALVRWLRHRRSRFEPLYVALFVVFGLTDVLESYRVTAWLLACKGLVFTNLLALRAYLVAVHYRDARL